jgi:heme exporter protein A
LITPLLQLSNLSCERDERLLIDQLNVSVSPGDIFQIEGPNGSGKTTLLRVLSGLSDSYEGDIFWRGQPILSVRNDFLSHMLYIGHLSGIKAILSPRENLQWYASLKGVVDDARLMAALDKVGLYGYEDVPCHLLSAGQQRRVGLARLFITEAEIWLLDEPFTAIDKQGVKQLEGWIEEYAAHGGAVILTTHHELSIEQGIQHIHLGETS